jgi:hypothetical protein
MIRDLINLLNLNNDDRKNYYNSYVEFYNIEK